MRQWMSIYFFFINNCIVEQVKGRQGIFQEWNEQGLKNIQEEICSLNSFSSYSYL